MSNSEPPKIDPEHPETWPARQTYTNETWQNKGLKSNKVIGVDSSQRILDFESVAKIMQATSFTVVLSIDDLSCGLSMTHDAIREEIERLNASIPGLKLKVSSDNTAATFERHGFEPNDDKNLGFIRRMMNGTMSAEEPKADIAAKGELDPYKIRESEHEEGDDEEDVDEHITDSSEPSDDDTSNSTMSVGI